MLVDNFKREVDAMSGQVMITKDEQYCSVEESTRDSFKEIKLMREGKKKKNSLDDLWKKIEGWTEEDGV